MSGSGAPYIVMEYLRGEDLATRLRRGPMQVTEAVDIRGGTVPAAAADSPRRSTAPQPPRRRESLAAGRKPGAGIAQSKRLLVSTTVLLLLAALALVLIARACAAGTLPAAQARSQAADGPLQAPSDLRELGCGGLRRCRPIAAASPSERAASLRAWEAVPDPCLAWLPVCLR